MDENDKVFLQAGIFVPEGLLEKRLLESLNFMLKYMVVHNTVVKVRQIKKPIFS
jgi:hypothetical protein